jgi:hypothetical protein
MRHPDPAPVVPPLTAEQLPDAPGLLKGMILELLDYLQQQQRDKEALQHRLDLLLQRLYGPRGERFAPNQPLLFGDPVATTGPSAAASAASAAPAEPATPKRKCRPHGRRLPENLPRVMQHHELTQAERICPGCGQRRQENGQK